MPVKVIGAEQIKRALSDVAENIGDTGLVTEQLVVLMKSYVHRKTGYLAGTIRESNGMVEASAPYAGYEEERGGDHAFASRAIESFNMDKYADKVVEPF